MTTTHPQPHDDGSCPFCCMRTVSSIDNNDIWWRCTYCDSSGHLDVGLTTTQVLALSRLLKVL